jgi:hypothetical protein
VYFEPDVVGGPLQPLFGPGVADIEVKAPRGLRGRFPMIHTRYDQEETALSILRRVIWDGGTRADLATIDLLQRKSLVHCVRELVSVPVENRRKMIAIAPMLERYGETERKALLTLLGELSDPPVDHLDTAVAAAIEATPTLASKVAVVASYLNEEAAPEGEDEVEEQPEELELAPSVLEFELVEEEEEEEEEPEADEDPDLEEE